MADQAETALHLVPETPEGAHDQIEHLAVLIEEADDALGRARAYAADIAGGKGFANGMMRLGRRRVEEKRAERKRPALPGLGDE